MTVADPARAAPGSAMESRAGARRARRRRRWVALTVALVVFGAGIRVAQYASRQSFWADEAALLFNLTRKSTWQLVSGPLDHGQAAPPLFLALQRGVALTLGTGEYAQRLVPLLLGLASLPLAAALAWRWLPPVGAAFAVGMITLGDTLVFQSATLKPYSGDLLATIALLLIYLPPPGTPHRDAADPVRRVFVASCAAAVAVWCSLVVTIVFAGLAGAALVEVVDRSRRPAAIGASPLGAALARWAAALVPFAVSFAALYVLSVRHQSGDQYLHSFWTHTFPDWSRPASLPMWFLHGLWSVADFVAWPARGIGAIVLPLAVIGFVSLKRQGRTHVALALLAPVAATLLAAVLGQYPWTGRRVTIFLIPGIVMLAGAGVAGLATLPQRWPRWVAGAGVLPLALLLAVDVAALARPRTRTHLRPVLDHVRAHRAAGEPVFVSKPAYEFDWYWPHAPGPLTFAPPAASELAAMRPGTRLWYVVLPEDLEHPEEPLPGLDDLRARAREVNRFVVRGGAAYQFELETDAAAH